VLFTKQMIDGWYIIIMLAVPPVRIPRTT
jgi:hypothetical protein